MAGVIFIAVIFSILIFWVYSQFRYQNYLKKEVRPFIDMVFLLIPNSKLVRIGRNETVYAEIKKISKNHSLDFRIECEYYHLNISHIIFNRKTINETYFDNDGKPLGSNVTIDLSKAKHNQFSKSDFLEKVKIKITQLHYKEKVYEDYAIVNEINSFEIKETVTNLLNNYKSSGIYKKLLETHEIKPV